MASGRRGGPPDLKSTLGSLFRTTLDQASAVRDVVEQQTRSKGGLLDQALSQRKWNAAAAKLGEEVYRLARRGEIGELLLEPQIGMLIGELEVLDDVEHGQPASRPEAIRSADYAAQQQGTEPNSDGEFRVWRPVMPEGDVDVETEGDDQESPSAAESRPSRLPRRSAIRKGGGIHFAETGPRPEDPDSDDDLAAYMHEDDVPDK